MRLMFKEENVIFSIANDCRVVILDSQISIRAKTFCLVWLADYAKVNDKFVRQLFEKDVKLLQGVYNKMTQLLLTSEMTEVRENLRYLVGSKKM